jgi:Putative prokaryotic signal transducing protein
MSDTELVVVRTFLNRIEAELAKGALQASGIESIIRADDVGGTRPAFWMSGVPLLVRAEDLEAATQVLGSS